MLNITLLVKLVYDKHFGFANIDALYFAVSFQLSLII